MAFRGLSRRRLLLLPLSFFRGFVLRNDALLQVLVHRPLQHLIQFNDILQLDDPPRLVEHSIEVVSEGGVRLHQDFPQNEAVLNQIRTVVVIRVHEGTVQQGVVDA